MQNTSKQHFKLTVFAVGNGGSNIASSTTAITPLLLNILHRKNIQTFCIVTIPFTFEGKYKIVKALAVVEQIKESGTAFTVYNNEILRQEFGDKSIKEAFEFFDSSIADKVSDVYEKEDWIIDYLKKGGEIKKENKYNVHISKH